MHEHKPFDAGGNLRYLSGNVPGLLVIHGKRDLERHAAVRAQETIVNSACSSEYDAGVKHA